MSKDKELVVSVLNNLTLGKENFPYFDRLKTWDKTLEHDRQFRTGKNTLASC